MANFQGTDYVLYNNNNQQQMFQQGGFQQPGFQQYGQGAYQPQMGQQQDFQQYGQGAYQPQMGQQQYVGFDGTQQGVPVLQIQTGMGDTSFLYLRIVNLKRKILGSAIFLIILQLITTICMPDGLYCLQGIIVGVLAIVAASSSSDALLAFSIFSGVIGLGPLLYIEIQYARYYNLYVYDDFCYHGYYEECEYNGWHGFLYFELWCALFVQIIVIAHLGGLKRCFQEWRDVNQKEFPNK